MIEPIKSKASLQPWKGELDLLKVFEFIKNPSVVIDAISNSMNELSKLRLDIDLALSNVNAEIEKANVVISESESCLREVERKEQVYNKKIFQLEQDTNSSRIENENYKAHLKNLQNELDQRTVELNKISSNLETKEKQLFEKEKTLTHRETELELSKQELSKLEVLYKQKLDKIKTLAE